MAGVARAGGPATCGGGAVAIWCGRAPPPQENVTLPCVVAGPADHLTCFFSPPLIIADGAALSTATVRVRDVLGNRVSTGSYSVTLELRSTTTPGGSTTLVTTNPQLTVNGSAKFPVRATTTTGLDTYAPSITPGSSPTLPNSHSTTGSATSVASTFPLRQQSRDSRRRP